MAYSVLLYIIKLVKVAYWPTEISLCLSSYMVCFHFMQEQTEQVKASNKQLVRIFDFLEKTLLRGRVEKRKFLQSSMKGTSSNILESRQSQNILLTEEFEHRRFK